jgi:hypothetical protein
MNQQGFLQELTEYFPYLKDDIFDDDYEGLFSLQIGIFRNRTQEAIDNNDEIRVNSHIHFILKNFNRFDNKVENSIVLSYIQKLNFKNYPVPEKFQEIQDALNQYRESTYKDERGKKNSTILERDDKKCTSCNMRFHARLPFKI